MANPILPPASSDDTSDEELIPKRDPVSHSRLRNAFVTLFSDKNEYVIPPSELHKSENVQWLVRSPEELTTTGRSHYHYGVQFTKKMSFREIKKLFRNNTINIKPMKGTPEQVALYCSPDFFSKKKGLKKSEYTTIQRDGNEQIILGAPKSPGARTDWESIYAACKDLTRPIRSILDEFPKHAVRYEQHIRRSRARVRYEQHIGKKFNRELIIRTGVAGTGKDYDVYAEYGAENVYELAKDENGAVWWDGYEGQDVLLISDWNNTLTRARLLNITGDRMVRVNIKGGTEWWTGTKVVITSNFPIETWYHDWDGTKYVDDALVSRIDRLELYELKEESERVDRSVLAGLVVRKENWRLKTKRAARENRKKKKGGGGLVLPPSSGQNCQNKMESKVKHAIQKETRSETTTGKAQVASAKTCRRHS